MKRPFNFFIGGVLWIQFLVGALHKDNIVVLILLLILALANIWIGLRAN